jgi:hypothetical protein
MASRGLKGARLGAKYPPEGRVTTEREEGCVKRVAWHVIQQEEGSRHAGPEAGFQYKFRRLRNVLPHHQNPPVSSSYQAKHQTIKEAPSA